MIKRYKDSILLILIFIITFTLITLNIKNNKGIEYLQAIVLTVFSPIQSSVTFVTENVSNFLDGYINVINVKKENEELKKEIERLQFENNIHIEEKLQYERLKKLLGVNKNKYNVSNSVVAQVIGFDSTNWAKMIMINKGKEDGIQYNMVVTANNGIIGRIIYSSNDYSKVLLLTDPRSSVDAILQKNRVRGVVVGTNSEILKVKYLPVDAVIEKGDIVVSSGLGGIFPKGLIIGTIISFEKDILGLFQNATLKPGAMLSQVEEVLVLTN